MQRILVVSVIVMASALAAGLAQETTGWIVGFVSSQDGRILPGVAVTARNPDTGLELSVVSDRRGHYRLPALPPAKYTVTAALEGFQTWQRTVSVALGQTVTGDVEMAVGAFTDTIEVAGEAPAIDTQSIASGITVDADELNALLPIPRDVTRIALLAPGTVVGDPRFQDLNDTKWNGNPGDIYTPGQRAPVVSGASVAENGYLVNGLNITSSRQMIGSSFVPMEFVDEVQVKTGGYEAEFGRSTGGTINMVTKSGTNTLRGGASVYWEPGDLQELEPDTFKRDDEGDPRLYRANSNEDRESLESNASLGGPILRDRLFFFGFVRYSDWSRLDMWRSDGARRSEATDPYWGGKLDWNITSSHRLEGTFLSDVVTVDETFFDVDPATGTVGDLTGAGYSKRGGDSWMVRYSGLLRDNLLLSAQGGVSPFDRTTRADADDACPVAVDAREGRWDPIGCAVNTFTGTASDERRAYRLDVDWFVGRHSLRAGVDGETNSADDTTELSGGVGYLYFSNGFWGQWYPEYPEDQEFVEVQVIAGPFSYEVLSNAAYLQDGWSVTPKLTLNLGLRWERYESKNATGETFMEVNDQVAPRLGAVWDVAGNGRSKLYGVVGVYHLPMSTAVVDYVSSPPQDDGTVYTLVGGVNPDGSPQGIGEQVDYHNYRRSPDPRRSLDSAFDPMSQSELTLGFEQAVGSNWSMGLRGVARRFNEVIEDVMIGQALWEVYGVECMSPEALATNDDCFWESLMLRITNPGSDFSGWFDLDFDGELDPISFTAEQLGIPEGERTYYALELTARRRFASRWMLQGSYTWSHLYGNFDGLANSDTAQDRPYLSATFDLAGLMEHSSGDLPNDRRHNLKLFGTYAFDFGLQLSASGWFRAGRPLNGFGVHPTDPWAQATIAYSFYNGGEPCPRGCAGRTDSAWALDLGVKYDWFWLGADWNVRVDAFNVTNNGAVEAVDESADNDIDQPNPNYLMPRYYQTPRQVRLGLGVSF